MKQRSWRIPSLEERPMSTWPVRPLETNQTQLTNQLEKFTIEKMKKKCSPRLLFITTNPTRTKSTQITATKHSIITDHPRPNNSPDVRQHQFNLEPGIAMESPSYPWCLLYIPSWFHWPNIWRLWPMWSTTSLRSCQGNDRGRKEGRRR